MTRVHAQRGLVGGRCSATPQPVQHIRHPPQAVVVAAVEVEGDAPSQSTPAE
ncbi:MAG TPA: hypothetical protein VGF90_01140 [Verrucomicrobiae bacterium]